MKFERMGVYKKKVDDDISYMLVLGTSGGINIAYFTNNSEKYENIESPMKEGYFQFDHCMYIPVSRIYSRNLSFVRKVSYREYSDMMSKISDYFLGNIVLRNGKFYYYDENTDDTKAIIQNETKVKEEHARTSNLSTKNPDKTERKPERVVINATRNPDIIKSQEDALRKFGIPVEFNKNVEDHTRTHGIDSNISNDAPSNTELMASLSNDDVLAIAVSDWYTVSKKYNISERKAYGIIRECKLKMGFEVREESHNRENFYVLFDKGYSIADIARMSGKSEQYIKNIYYSHYCIAKNAVNSFTAVDSKYRTLMENKEYRILSDTIDKSVTDLARNEKCTISTARKIYNNIKDFLCRNIFYSAGFGVKSFYDIDKYISSIRSSSKSEDIGVVMVYDICKSLKPFYEDTYDNHTSFLIGIENIPDSVPKDLQNCFLTLIYNRTHYSIGSKNRKLNKDQSECLSKNDKDCICEIMVNFMMVDRKKIISIRKGYSRQ